MTKVVQSCNGADFLMYVGLLVLWISFTFFAFLFFRSAYNIDGRSRFHYIHEVMICLVLKKNYDREREK